MLAQDPASIYCKLSPLLDEEWPRKDPYPGQILGYENRERLPTTELISTEGSWHWGRQRQDKRIG